MESNITRIFDGVTEADSELLQTAQDKGKHYFTLFLLYIA